MLQPRSIAVIGASTVPNSFGERATRHFDRIGYEGEVYFVNPRYDAIAGRRCYPDIASIPGDVDTAVVLVAARAVPEAMRELAKKNCRGAVILGSGFGEAGAGGDHLQEELLAIARTHNIRFIGPNTNGVVNVRKGVPLGFSSVLERPHLDAGGLAVVCQSGSIAASFADSAMDRGAGVSYVLGIGNAIDVGATDLLHFLAEDVDTTAAFVFIEGLQQPEEFFAAARRFRAAGKTLVLAKVGRSAAGRQLAATHSGSIAGSWVAFRDIAEDCGAIVATSLDEALDYCTVAARQRLPIAVPRLGVVTTSGALSGLIADEADANDLPLADFSDPALVKELQSMGFRAPFNPLDYGQALPGAERRPDFHRVCELILHCADVDILLVATGLTHHLPHMAEVLAELRRHSPKPIFGFIVGSTVAAPYVAALEAANIPVFRRLPSVIQAIRRASSSLIPEARHNHEPKSAPVGQSFTLLDTAKSLPSEYNLAAWLETCGLRYPERVLVDNAASAIDAARTLGYPVALKVVGSRILHKSVAGLIRLPLTTDIAVREAFDACSTAAHKLGVWEGQVMIQSLVDLRGGVELIAAVRNDIEVGPMLMVGVGGAIAEAISSATIGPLPESGDDVERLIRRSPLLDKLFNQDQRNLDRHGLVKTLLGLGHAGRAALDHFTTIEVNPIVVLPEGRGCWALDASASRNAS